MTEPEEPAGVVLIRALDRWLRDNRPGFYQHLAPGASHAEISALEKTLGVELPPPFRLFLSWHNGQVLARPAMDTESFFENYILLSCDGIIESAAFLNDLLRSGMLDSTNRWSTQWVPFLYDFTGNHYCIDTGGGFGGTKGQILQYWHDEPARPILHASFIKWLETIVTAAEQGVLPYGGSGREQDYERILMQVNPGYPIDVAAGE